MKFQNIRTPEGVQERLVSPTKSAQQAFSFSQSLGSFLKSALDIMRKDKGRNSDLDRSPLLTWIMFLEFLDDLEIQREHEAKLAGKKFKPAIEKPYRWRDWAAQAEVNGLKRLQAETSAELDALLPAILDRAFKGGW